MKEDNKSKKKLIPRSETVIPIRDFVYLCIILTIILIAIVTLTVGESSRAGEYLNFAATLASIILAVLAIVITLTESNGQKESIRRLEDVTEGLENNLVLTQQLLTESQLKSEEQVQAIKSFKKDVLEHSQTAIESAVSEIHTAVKKIKSENGVIRKEDIEELIEKSKSKINVRDYFFEPYTGNNTKFRIKDISSFSKIRKLVKNRIKVLIKNSNEPLQINDIGELVTNELETFVQRNHSKFNSEVDLIVADVLDDSEIVESPKGYIYEEMEIPF